MLVVEVSARHVHLSEQDAIALGISKELEDKTNYRELSVHGEFATNTKLTIHGYNGRELQATVLMPYREYSQVELSRTNCISLGLTDVPKRMSGDLKGAPYISVSYHLSSEAYAYVPVIVPVPHIHAPRDYKMWHKTDVNVKHGVLFDVPVKFNEVAHPVLHLDTDTANAFDLQTGDKVFEGIF